MISPAVRHFAGLLALLTGLSLLLGNPVWSQTNRFGLKVASNLYQPLGDQISDLPGLGTEAGFVGRFGLGNNDLTQLMPEVFYTMGNGPLPSSNVNLGYGTIPPSAIVEIHRLFHMGTGGIYLMHSLSEEERFSLMGGIEASYLLGGTDRVEYLPPFNNPENTIIESFPMQLENSSGEEIQRWYVNFRYGLETRLFLKSDWFWKLYLNLIHQVDQRPYLPAGAALGIKIYFPSKLRRR